MEKNIIIQISGGVGKHIAFTSLIPLIHEKYENIYLITPYGSFCENTIFRFQLQAISKK